MYEIIHMRWGGSKEIHKRYLNRNYKQSCSRRWKKIPQAMTKWKQNGRRNWVTMVMLESLQKTKVRLAKMVLIRTRRPRRRFTWTRFNVIIDRSLVIMLENATTRRTMMRERVWLGRCYIDGCNRFGVIESKCVVPWYRLQQSYDRKQELVCQVWLIR